MEELEHALKEYNMGDTKTIKEIIAEVDTDNVYFLLFSYFLDFSFRIRTEANSSIFTKICLFLNYSP